MTTATPDLLRSVQDPTSWDYRMARKEILKRVMPMSKKDVGDLLAYMAMNPDAIKDESNLSSKIV